MLYRRSTVPGLGLSRPAGSWLITRLSRVILAQWKVLEAGMSRRAQSPLVSEGGESNMTYTSAPILQPNDAFKSCQGAAGVRENWGEPWEPVNGTIRLLSGWNIQLWLLHWTLTRHNVTASVMSLSTWKAVRITTYSIWFWTHVISHNAYKYVCTYIHTGIVYKLYTLLYRSLE